MTLARDFSPARLPAEAGENRLNDDAGVHRESFQTSGRRPRQQSEMSQNPTIPLDFGAWLSELVKRVQIQQREIEDLKERLERLEPVATPLTPAQMCLRHGFKLGTVRDWLFHRATNGLEECGAVVTKGRRLYLYEAPFLRWLRDTLPVERRRVGR